MTAWENITLIAGKAIAIGLVKGVAERIYCLACSAYSKIEILWASHTNTCSECCTVRVNGAWSWVSSNAWSTLETKSKITCQTTSSNCIKCFAVCTYQTAQSIWFKDISNWALSADSLQELSTVWIAYSLISALDACTVGKIKWIIAR